MRSVLLALLLLFAAAGSASAQILGFNGTWKLNPEKTMGPHAKSEVIIYEVTATEEHYQIDEVEQDGSLFKTEYRARFDGQDYPNKNLVTGTVTTVAIKKLGDRVEELTNKRDGKVTSKYLRVLSEDGRTITSLIISADGRVTSVRVFDKQP